MQNERESDACSHATLQLKEPKEGSDSGGAAELFYCSFMMKRNPGGSNLQLNMCRR